MEYTKEKWTDEGDVVITAEDGRQIASVFPRDRQGNSRLIANAPVMYEALKAVFDLGVDAEESAGLVMEVLVEKVSKALDEVEGK